MSARAADPESRTAARSGAGLFVVLDGVDGCGKSTQARLLCDALTAEGRDPLHLREPGSTTLGEQLRALILSRTSDMGASVETLLFVAARAQMLAEIVRPALALGRDVVCERGNPSTFAYQAVAGELDVERVTTLLRDWAGEPAPDVVVLLELEPGAALARRGAARDRIEDKGLAFQERVAQGYAQWCARDPRAVRVDASLSAAEVARRVQAEVQRARR